MSAVYTDPKVLFSEAFLKLYNWHWNPYVKEGIIWKSKNYAFFFNEIKSYNCEQGKISTTVTLIFRIKTA